MKKHAERQIQAVVVSTDRDLGERVHQALTVRGFRARHLVGFTNALVALHTRIPDLLVIAGKLGSVECGEASSQLRDVSKVPLLVLCDSSSSSHVAEALRKGADDHVPTAIDEGELHARVTALLRRNQLSGQLQTVTVEVGMLRLDSTQATCAVNGTKARLTPNEFKLITALAMRSGDILSHNELIEWIWGSPYHSSADNLRKLVQRTRATLATVVGSREIIAAVPGFGYRLEVGEEANV